MHLRVRVRNDIDHAFFSDTDIHAYVQMSFGASIGAVSTGAGGTYASTEQAAESLNRTLDNLLTETFADLDKRTYRRKKNKKKLPAGFSSLVGPKQRPAAGMNLLDQAAFASGVHHLATSAYTQGGLKQIFNRQPEMITKFKSGKTKHVTYGKQPDLLESGSFKTLSTPRVSEVKSVLRKNLPYYPPIQDETFRKDEHGNLQLNMRAARTMIGNEVKVQKSERIKKDVLGDAYPADDPLQARKYFALSDNKVLRAGLSETEQLGGLMKDNNADPSVLEEAFSGGNLEDFNEDILEQIKHPEEELHDAYDILTGYKGKFVQGPKKYNPTGSMGSFMNEIRRYGLDFYAPPPDVKNRYGQEPELLKTEMAKYNESREKSGKKKIEDEKVLKKRTLRELQKLANAEHENRKNLVKDSKSKFKMLVKLVNDTRDSPEKFKEAIIGLSVSDLHYIEIALKKDEYESVSDVLTEIVTKRREEVIDYNKANHEITVNMGHLNVVEATIKEYYDGHERPADLTAKIDKSIELITTYNDEIFFRAFTEADTVEEKRELLEKSKQGLSALQIDLYQGLIDSREAKVPADPLTELIEQPEAPEEEWTPAVATLEDVD